MSDLEDLLISQIAEAGLPPPIREHRFAKEAMGRQWRWDLCWPDKLVAVEVDGGGWSGGRHVRGSGFAKDIEKQNAGTMLGYRLLRFDAKLVKSGDAVDMIGQLLARLEGSMNGGIATLDAASCLQRNAGKSVLRHSQ